MYRPESLGSGGCYGSAAGAGGGAVRLEAAGTLTVNGTVSARATTAESYSASGGSVLLIGGTIAGSGIVNAAGANNTFRGGGGGRIALVQTVANDFTAWTGKATAFGGANGTTLCGHGTVYYEPANRPYAGDLELKGTGAQLWPTTKNFSYVRDNTENKRWCGTILTGTAGETELHFGTITVSDYGHLGIGTGVTVVCDELDCKAVGKDIVTLYGGTLRFTRAAKIAGGALRCYKAGSRIDFTDGAEDKTLTLTGVEFVADAACSIGGNLVVGAGATVDHTRVVNLTTLFGVDLDVEGSMTVDETGKVTAQASGYYTSAAPGYPTENGFGGCHGGLSSGANGEFCYGSIRKPTTYGSGSHANATNPGGGVIRLKVAESLSVNGVVTAMGGNNYNSFWDAGAGGSVWISAKTLSGTGSIDANGGWCTHSDSGEGGGGRVAVWLTGAGADFSNFDTAKITANGARKSNDAKNPVTSGCGTVYLKTGEEAENEGTLVISNPGAKLGADKMSARIGPAVTDTDVGRVVIRDAGALTIAAGCTLSVRDEWKNELGDRFVADVSSDPAVANAAVVFRDAAVEAKVSGTNTFCNLTCTEPGKTVRFGTADDATMTTVSGMLTVAGSEESPVALKSFTDNVFWPLAVVGGAAVSDAIVWDSDARFGNAISATASTGLRCENWTFSSRIVPGETITWTGADATDPTAWTQIGNWDPARVPVETDQVVIPEGRPAYPKLSDNTTFNSLTVESGAALDLNSYSVAVTNVLAVAGELTATGVETLTLTGPSASFAGATVVGAAFSLTLGGELVQTANLGGLAFKSVAVDKPTGRVDWTAGFSADVFTCTANAPLEMSFAAGALLTFKRFELDGVGPESTAKNLTLASSVPLEKWRIKVTQYPSVSGVRVSDSDASGALKIYDLAPGEDLGGNVNWDFGGVRAVWTGGVQDNCYTNALNWTPNRVPDETSAMIVSGNATVKMPADETCKALSLLVTGTGNTISGAADSRFEIADTLTLDGGSLQLDVATSVANGGVLRNGSTITHKANETTDLYGLDLEFGGDLQIDATSKITAQGKGYQNGSAYPGSARLVGDSGQAIAHGGRPRRYADICACYGSALHPRTIAGSTANYAKGGGKIRLQVAGALMVDGAVQANGADGNWMSAPGGSVWVTAGTLAGKGTISANAGTPSNENSQPWGGGGRVAVYLTQASDFAAFGGVISAYGSKTTVESAKRRSSAGTVFLKGKDDNGFLIVDNDDAVPEEGDAFFTDFVVPEERGGDPIEGYRDVTVILRNWGTLNLLQDVKVADLIVETNSAKFVLNDHILKVTSMEHRNGLGWRGETNKKAAKAYVDSICDKGTEGLGAIDWPRPGLMLMVR